MNSDERERRRGDLRDVVIDVMLEAGEEGVNSFDRLLEKAALELRKRDGLSAGPRHVLFEPALRPGDPELTLEIVWDLTRQGTLTFGPDASHPNWPHPRRSRFGERAVRRGPDRSHETPGFMKALRLDVADISPDTVVYLKEAVTAFYMDCLLSTCVTLSIAAEGEFLRLLNGAKNSATYGQYFSRIGDGANVAVKISQFKDAISPIRDRFPRAATDELDHNLDTVQSLIRTARKDSGEPAGARPPSRDQTHLYLQLFIPFAKQAKRLRQELKEARYPRLVQLH